jgi:hypothetical protein
MLSSPAAIAQAIAAKKRRRRSHIERSMNEWANERAQGKGLLSD